MAYTKHEWVTGEIITAANLNHIEDGIASKLDANAVVNSQEADTPGTALDAMQGNPDVPGSLAAQIKEAGESSKAIVLTQAQYDALSDEEKDSDNVYYISDSPFESSNVVPLTRAEYDALTEATKNDGRFYYITDEAEVAKSLVVQTNVNSTETVPSSAVVYGLKSDIDSQISDLSDSFTVSTSATVIDTNVALSGDTAWHNTEQTIDYSAYKYLVVTCGCHGAVYNSIIVPKAILAITPSNFLRVSAFYDTSNQGCVEIYNTGRFYAFAKTQNYQFDVIVKGFK